jgi:hypothetical protein
VADDLGTIGDKGSKFLEAFAADILASVRLIDELPIPTVASLAGMALARTLIRTWATGRVSAADIISTQLGAGILDTKDGAEGMAIAVAAVRKREPIPKIQFSGKWLDPVLTSILGVRQRLVCDLTRRRMTESSK